MGVSWNAPRRSKGTAWGYRHLLVVGALVGLGAPPGSAGGLRFTIQATETTTMSPRVRGPIGEEPPKPTVEKTLGRCWIGRKSFLLERGNEQIYYDFEVGQRVTVNLDSGTFLVDPLVSIVEALDAELQNREYLRDVDEEKGWERGDAFAPIVTELELALRVPGRPAAAVARELVGEEIVFALESRTTLRLKPSEWRVPAELTETWTKLLLYEFRVHPAVVDEVVSERFPQSLDLVRPSAAGERRTVAVFESVGDTTTGPSLPTAGLERVFHAEESIARLLRQLHETQCDPPETYISRGNAAAARGAYLTAALSYLECGLATGVKLVDPLSELRSSAGDDPSHDAFWAALAKGKTDPESAAARFEELRPAAGPEEHVLRVLRANMLSSADREAEAKTEMIMGIRGNPCIAGAWVDLASLIHDSYNPNVAWECIEAARTVAPDHPFLERSKAFQKNLQEMHPERF